MKNYLLITWIAVQGLLGTQTEYFSLLQKLEKPTGSWEKGEIEIVTDPKEIVKISEIQKNRLLKKGLSNEIAQTWSTVGVIAEDTYWIWIRDAVYFPNKVPGTYDRLLWKVSIGTDNGGVAILPILPDGKIALNLNYRHATRSWELELPRGAKSEQESNEEAARRELREETGQEVSSLHFLGNMTPDSGTVSSVVPVYLGKVSSKGKEELEYSEAIAGILTFTKQELYEGLTQGFLEVELNGSRVKVPLRDAFLTFALLQAQIRKML